VLGIDFGTESCRVAVFTADGAPVAFAATGYPTSFPAAGWAEQQPADWWHALTVSTRQVMAQSGVAPGDIAGIGYAATSQTMVALDRAGEPLRPAIMWMDVRAAAQAGRASTPQARQALGRMADNVPGSAEMFPFKAAWLKENEPGLYQRTTTLLDAPDWLGYRLTGELRVNENSASVKMYYSRAGRGFPAEFYDIIGCGDALDKVPAVVQPLGTVLGGLSPQAASELGLRPGTPVAQGCIDAYAGQIGLGVLSPGRMALITGSSHALIGQAPAALAGTGLTGAFMDAVTVGECTVEAAVVSSGSAIRWFRDNFCKDLVREADASGSSAYDMLNRSARDIPPGSDGLIVVPYFQGSRNPSADSRARGVVWGLSLHHSETHLYHAIQEGICYGVAHNLRNLASHGYEVDELVACGGALKSTDWIQMHADITGKPITLTKVTDAVSLGSCIMAAVAAELYPSVAHAAAAMVHVKETYQPDPERNAEYERYLHTYMETYPRLRELQHALAAPAPFADLQRVT
jgi:ribulose kinase